MTERHPSRIPSRILRIIRSDKFRNVVEALRSGGVSTIVEDRPKGLPLNPDSRLGLGTRQEEIDGDEYKGRLTGKAYVTGDHDEGSFLSDKSFKQYRGELNDARDKGHYSDDNPPPERKHLGMSELFPEGWNESKVEYTITVRARRVTSPATLQETSDQQ